MYFVKKNDESRNSFLEDFNNFFTGGMFSKDLKTDIEQTDKEYLVTVDVPGMNKKDISLTFEDSTLTISINKNQETEDKKKNYIRKERSMVSMSRSFYLENGDENQIKAKMEDGVLKITIGKVETKPIETKAISIE